ncbi:hypothetical protein LI328DRAFT_167693 [Trichoderma asperelloides]|nr:hypothetical protein LI328DRAFT_167693 [Trichoderma asperelloides]
MSEALYGNVNYPPRGFSGLHDKALWMCGDTSWKWYTKEMNDPYITPTKPLYLSRPDIFMVAAGAWVHKQRFITNGDPRSVGVCRPNVFASTRVKEDFITFCDFFSDRVSKAESPVGGKNSVVVGETTLDHFQDSGSRIMFHELVHWFGTTFDERGDLIRLPDQQAVSADGDLVWVYTDKVGRPKLTTTSKQQTGISYAKWVVWPAMATNTAETYAYFAMMAYLDNFDWSGDGIAKNINGD